MPSLGAVLLPWILAALTVALAWWWPF